VELAIGQGLPQPSGAISTAAAALWGKTGPDRAWHPLAAHLVDTVSMAQELWVRWVSPATCSWLSESFDHDLEAAGSFFAWLAGCHDLGKASPAFQIQVDWLADAVRAAGFQLPEALANRSKAPHALVSAAGLVPILEGYGWRPGSIEAVAAILGGHHGWFPLEGFTLEPRRRPDLYGWSTSEDAPWMVARRELFDLVVHVSEAEELLTRFPELQLGRAREMALTGYVILADWIASNAELFPYLSAPARDDYVSTSRDRATSALATIGWRRHQFLLAGLEKGWFAARFGYSPNSLQRATIELAALAREPSLLLVEAPMGAGKTEAALAAVEVLGARQGLEGVFIGLPTQATSNQMFHRVKTWLERMGPGDFLLQLAHGRANQVSEYRQLAEIGAPGCIDVDSEHEGSVVAAAWFAGSKRRLLAPFVVGTVDQALMCAAKVRYVALRQVGLVGKVVVIDEVHAYDAYTSVFLRRALSWLGSAGVPVVLLSATLPPTASVRLAEAYAGRAIDLGAVNYPSVTAVARDGTASSLAVNLDEFATSAQIEWLDEELDDSTCARLCARVFPMAATGANVLVVRNTVGRAQEAYRALAQMSPSAHLLHSRFTAADRLEKETWLAHHFGPKGERLKGQIVVGTQVLEQSLDIDFDALVTDLAPVDLVLQRLGRVQRHRGVSRPAGFGRAGVIIAGAHRQKGAPPALPRGSVAVYGEHLLLRTVALLDGRTEIALPGDLATLVSSVYGDDDVVPTSWSARAAEAQKAWTAAQHARELRAETFAIAKPDLAENLLELCRIGLGDPDDDDPVVQAAVRDAPESVEVALACASSRPGYLCFTGIDVPVGTAPDPYQVDAVLSSVVRLPSFLTSAALALEVPVSWREHSWLRRQRVLRLDTTGETGLGHNRVRYTSALGLEVDGHGG